MSRSSLEYASDQLGEVINEAEEFIEAMGLGVEAAVDIPGPIAAQVAYRRTKAGWKLCYVDEEHNVLALNQVSRARKCDALMQLDDLLVVLTGEANLVEERILETISYVKGLLRLAADGALVEAKGTAVPQAPRSQ